MPHAQPTWAEFVSGWQLDIYRDPIYCGMFAGLVLGYLGVYVVLRRMVFITAAVSQAAGLGVALSFLVQIKLSLAVPPVVGAVTLSLAVAGIFALPLERLRMSRESLLGVAYLLAWAGAVMVGDRIAQEAHDISAILFGTAVLVRAEDFYTLLGVGGFALGWHMLVHRGLVFAIFDPEGARVQRLPVRLLDLSGFLLTALTVSVATRALGVLPVFAFAVLPGATGLLLADRVRWVLVIAALIGALAGAFGYLLAFFLEFPVGACQTVVAAAPLLIALPVRLLRGRLLRG
ncbi:MAG TPA: metal ABC transporter permease [Polyangiales bacterium]